MKLLKFKYAVIPLIVLTLCFIVQIPIISFVKTESSRYMLTNYREDLRKDILKVVESNVRNNLRDVMKSEVIQELRVELLDEVLDNLREDLTREIRESRQWINTSSSKIINIKD